jgi:hypothetical protein
MGTTGPGIDGGQGRFFFSLQGSRKLRELLSDNFHFHNEVGGKADGIMWEDAKKRVPERTAV